MNRFTITTLLAASVWLTIGTEAVADHQRGLRRELQVRQNELQYDFRARREANRFSYHRERDFLRAERSRALRIDCHETRTFVVRSINRQLTALSRDFHSRNREISAWYRAAREELRNSFEIAIQGARRTGVPVVVSRSLVDEGYRGVPAYPCR